MGVVVKPKPIADAQSRSNYKFLAIDTETTGLSTWHGDRPFAVSACEIWMINGVPDTSLMRDYYWRGRVYKDRSVYWSDGCLRDIQQTIDRLDFLVFFNAKFDIRMLESIGISIRKPYEEVSFMVKCLYSELQAFNLKFLSEKILDYPVKDQADLRALVRRARKQAKQDGWKTHTTVDADYFLPGDYLGQDAECEIYARLDAERTAALYLVARQQLDNDSLSDKVYKRELKLLEVVRQMEHTGIHISERRLEYHKDRLSKELQDLRKSILEISNGIVENPRSRLQVLEFMESLKLPALSTTAKGDWSASTETLKDTAKWVHKNMSWSPKAFTAQLFIQSMLAFRKAETHRSFVDLYHTLAVEDLESGRCIHGSFNQYGAQTGRFSASDPNLQNVDDSLRDIFIPRPGHYFVFIDFNQIEMRLFALLSRDKTLLEAATSGEDIYTWTAIQAWGKQETEEKQKEMRSKAKGIALGKIYGLGVDKAMELAGYDEGDHLMETFEERFPGIQEYIHRRSIQAGTAGYIRTLSGRRVGVPRDKTYKAVNYEDQGTAADLLKISMLKTHRICQRQKHPCRLLVPVHDEIIFEVSDKIPQRKIIPKLANTMANSGLPIPTPVSASYSYTSWKKEHKQAFNL